LIKKNINYNYVLQCVQLQLKLQLLQKCNQLQLITITHYNCNIAALEQLEYSVKYFNKAAAV